MKKQTTTILLLAGAGALAYFLFKGKGSGARMIESEAEAEASEETGKGAEQMPEQPEVDAVIDVTKTGQTVRQAIQQGKELATAIKDANIIIKTPKGQSDIAIRKGAKSKFKDRLRAAKAKRKVKRSLRKGKRLMKRAKKYGDCSQIKSQRRRRRCEMAQQKAGSSAAKALSKFSVM